MYIVNSTDYIRAVLSKPTELSPWPISVDAMGPICGTSQRTEEILLREFCGEAEYSKRRATDFHHLMSSTLVPEQWLDEVNPIMIESLRSSFAKLQTERSSQGPTVIGIQAWLKHELSLATTNSIFGPHNPYKDPGFEAAFWYVYVSALHACRGYSLTWGFQGSGEPVLRDLVQVATVHNGKGSSCWAFEDGRRNV